jgi:septum formation protein
VQLILASASPRRAQLLSAAGYRHEIFPVEIDERPRPNESASVYVLRLALEKSKRAAELLAALPAGSESRIVLAADTAVVVDDEILGKPGTPDEARRMLRMLSGRSHDVLTGVCIRSSGGGPGDRSEKGFRVLEHVETTAVFFAELCDADVNWYVQSEEGMDKAGGYAIQGLASRFVTRIEGSYSNVVGLPVAAVHGMLVGLEVSR